jgi:hypothetical protein
MGPPPVDNQHPRHHNPAQQVIAGRGFTVTIPSPGHITIPWEQLAFAGGTVVLAMASIIEWPLAAILVAGHVLTSQHYSKTLTAFGDALSQRNIDDRG